MIPLPPSQVHLWCDRTDIGDREFAERDALLSDQERLRAARFHDVKTTIAFTAAHGWLRRVLAAYVKVAPRKLRFSEGLYGKSSLVTDAGRSITFNLSHSGDLVLVGVTARMAIGVDIERIVPVRDGVAAECLTPSEAAALAAVAAQDRDEAFMRCWTRKQAYLKARGTGLNTPLDDFDVSINASARLLQIGSDPAEAAHWQFVDLSPAPGYCGAVAARHQGWSCVWMSRPGKRSPAYGGGLNARPNAASA